MEHKLPELPYEYKALEPHITAETLEYHHDKHHANYVKKLNKLVSESQFKDSSLENIITFASGNIFNNGAQVWNHTFYWNCLGPNSIKIPRGEIADSIGAQFGSFEEFKQRFTDSATGNFGSGWTWLVQNSNGSLEIINTSNAENPLRTNNKPLLACDVWEHAYYIDYRNSRQKYVEAFWNVVNWDFVNDQFKRKWLSVDL